MRNGATKCGLFANGGIAVIQGACDAYPMPELLHELWIHEDSSIFSRVDKTSDDSRVMLFPSGRYEFEVWASSWREAMQLHDQRAYGEFENNYDNMPQIPYTDDDAREQQAYLKVRANVR